MKRGWIRHGSLAQHKKAQCDHKATQRGSLARHKKKQRMKGWRNFAHNVTIRQLQRVILLNTKISSWIHKVHEVLAENVTIRQLQRVILLDTKHQFIKRWITLAGNVTIRQLQRVVLVNTKERYMKGWSTIAGNVTQKKTEAWSNLAKGPTMNSKGTAPYCIWTWMYTNAYNHH